MSRNEGSEYLDLDEGEGSALPAFLYDPAGILRRRWRWMVLTLVLGFAGTAAFVATQQPMFAAEAKVLVTSQRISQRFVQSTFEAGEFEKINAIMGEILSRNVLLQVVETHGLYQRPEEPVSAESRVGAVRRSLKIGLDDSMGRNAREEGARIYAVTYRHASPAVAARVANDIAARFTHAHLEMRGNQARVTTRFVKRELERAETELQAQEGRITEFKKTYLGELPDDLDANLSRLERLHELRQSLALQISEAERLAVLDPGSANGVPLSPDARLAQLRARLAEERGFRTPEHPGVVSLERQIAQLEARLAREAEESAEEPGTQSSGPITVRQLRQRLARTEASIATIDARVARTPEHQERLSALERRAEVLRESYQQFLRKVEEAELAEAVESAQQGERATVLEAAVPPTSPERPRALLAALGVAATIGLAVALAGLLEFIDRIILRADQIENEIGVPVLGSAGRIA